jgi:hypothetical protein
MTFTPAAVREVELSRPVTGLTAGPRYGAALVLARWYSEPVALVDIPLHGGAAGPRPTARALWAAAGPLLCARYPPAGLSRPAAVLARPDVRPGDPSDRYYGHPAGRARRAGAPVAGPDGFPAEMLTSGLRLPWPPAYLIGRATALRRARPASVIVCTRDRAVQLEACLAAVLRQEYPRFEVIVVDNAPATDAAARLVAQFNAGGTAGVPLRHVTEPHPGLSWARNTGLTAASGDIVAYLDDVEQPDRHWLAELARGFTLGQGVTGVRGLVLPAALDTPGRRRGLAAGPGRGLTPGVFDQASPARPGPRPAFGAGASMAFDRATLLRADGFDVGIGAGAPVTPRGRFSYWPGAVSWRAHRAAGPGPAR